MGTRRASALVPGFSVTKPPHAMVLGLDATDKATGISLAATTWAKIEFSEVVTDTDNWWDATNEDFTPTFTGIYFGWVQIRFDDEEFVSFRIYDVDDTSSPYGYGPVIEPSDGRSGFWQFQWWFTGGNTYRIEMYTASASTYLSDSHMMLTGPYVTGEE